MHTASCRSPIRNHNPLPTLSGVSVSVEGCGSVSADAEGSVSSRPESGSAGAQHASQVFEPPGASQQVHGFAQLVRLAGNRERVGLMRVGFADQIAEFEQLRTRMIRVADIKLE